MFRSGSGYQASPNLCTQVICRLRVPARLPPSSRAIRRVNGNRGTSAGGERPKATFEHEGRLWLVKMKDRGDLAGLPAREYTAMTLARQVGIDMKSDW